MNVSSRDGGSATERRARGIANETDPDRESAVLRERAAALARPDRHRVRGELLEIAVFRLGRELYGIELRWLVQIFPLRALAALPGATPPVIGLAPWRGTLLRILDLNAALGRRTAGIADRGRVLALGSEGDAEFGILVDTVNELRALDLAAIRPLPGDGGEPARPLRGVTPDAVLVIDAEALIRTFA